MNPTTDLRGDLPSPEQSLKICRLGPGSDSEELAQTGFDFWELVKDDFDEKIPRRTAIFVKEDDFSLSFAYPSNFGSIGWLVDCREVTTYDESPVAEMRFGEYSYPDLTGRHLARNTFHFGSMEYRPSLVRREVVLSNVGLEGVETFAQSGAGAFSWAIDLTCLNHPPYVFSRKLYSVISAGGTEATVRRHDSMKCLEIDLNGARLFIASGFHNFGVFRSTEDLLTDLEDGALSSRRRSGRHLVLEHELKLGYHERTRVSFGVSTRSQTRARSALKDTFPERALRSKWNNWFRSLPAPNFESIEDRKAYYKCWWIVRSNYYKHPRWGKTVLEAMPVYRGYWQWGLPAAQWHSSLNPEIGPSFVRTLLNLFLKNQRTDGYVPHAIYLSEKVPGESWSKQSLIQTPHIPWVALRYYYDTKDIRSLRRWYPKLARYYRYINESRDDAFLRLHLWAILASYDTGLDTTSAFQRVTYGESGAREKFCYPAIFAAERCRFERAMARIAGLLSTGEAGEWQRHSELTLKSMNDSLWDDEKAWYGVLHEDGSLDTRVGVDGLFALAYGLVDGARAEAAKPNFKKLLGRYGVFTVAPDEPGFCEKTYWRGPAWSKSCSLAMAAAVNYYPDLLKTVKDRLVRFLLRYPSVWECMSAETGEIARGDIGLMATPVVSSNLGAGEAIGALLTYYGTDMFSMDS